MEPRARKIFPRNLTAWAAYEVPGNPAVTRPEDAVGNCYPGLEVDVRNLDRRFFPGLVFEFVAREDVSSSYRDDVEYGARLAYIDDVLDPDLTDGTEAAGTLAAAIGDAAGVLGGGIWYLEWLEQAGRRLSTRFLRGPRAGQPFDGLFVWRLIRGLEPGPVTIGLKRREPEAASAAEVVLVGWRRLYTDPRSGVINAAYQPGELTQSLCSPWQHDFRDCACHYWASNRPDVVRGEIYPGEALRPGGRPADAELANERLDWMRAERSRAQAAEAAKTIVANRPYQLDHYQINRAWQELNVVVHGTEIGAIYVPRTVEPAPPFASPAELAKRLHDQLAPLEMTLALEYLYARFSLRPPDDVLVGAPPTLADDLIWTRHYLLLAATSEMQHLRWVNELLWGLHRAGLIERFEPSLEPGQKVPIAQGGERDRALRLLDPPTLDDFIAVEHPSATINGAYARVVATLRLPEYPPRLRELAERIVNDGVEHESWFRDIKTLLTAYRPDASGAYPYLRLLAVGDVTTDSGVAAAFRKYKEIVEGLRLAYREAGEGDIAQSGQYVARSRMAMDELLTMGETLAARRVGIPFWVSP